ncbi:hypothetical protein [Pelosinus sp. sgz500959]|uniref:hypothetical protein n=1 Tax=Pelosinus sp. sgz500959 TaxID=3242472 RepID=UPI00366B7D54
MKSKTKNSILKYIAKNNIKCNVAENTLQKIGMKKKFILIEGTDGSGKDTFASILVDKLKERFLYDENATLSIVGQPLSKCKRGEEALSFIEDKKNNYSKDVVGQILTENRIDTEKYFNKLGGITICIRGLLTDLATYYHVFGEEAASNLGQTIMIDKLIIVDVDSKIADNRITERGLPRTWREYFEYLVYFRDYYLKYESQLYREKIVIENIDLNQLDITTEGIANSLFISCLEE